ncbi:hypothetical protein HY493_03440 [Candidatus Woesearchaeota archaeon]|nr:hypothetical protein [Candidatus Woesearchaeota archaeon]
MSREDEFEVEGTIVRETDKALCLEIDGEKVWIPKSQIRDGLSGCEEEGEVVCLTIPFWLAEEKDLA